jgi:hypothetical protein
MNIVFPIVLEDPVFDPHHPTTPITSVLPTHDFDFTRMGVQVHVSGRDSSSENSGRGIRLTNLCGIHEGELFKICPHCQQVKPLTAYGDGGRTTDEFRDQSNCTECRGRYRLSE